MIQRGSFRRQEHKMPVLNTSSLPDLIFTVLFFFMIVTHMRDVDLKVRYDVPQGTEIQKLGHKAAVVNIYIGRPINAAAADTQTAPASSSVASSSTLSDFRLQLNNELATIDDIRDFIDRERNRMSPEDQARMTISIKADRDVPMGIIADVKRALQQSYALKISYAATERK